MKKIISLLASITLMAQLAFTVNAAEPVAEMKIDHLAAGATIQEYAHNNSSSGTAKVGEDENENKFIEVRDHDSAAESGVKLQTAISSGKATVSFDFMALPESKDNAKFYVHCGSGFVVCMTMSKTPNHYNGSGTDVIPAVINPGKWTNFTCILDMNAQTFDIYQDGYIVSKGLMFRSGNKFAGICSALFFGGNNNTDFNLKNVKIYDGEVKPDPIATAKFADRELVNYSEAPARLDEALKGAVAMSIGNSVARVDNGYVNIYPGEPYVAPYISDDGSTLIPARFATEAIGCEVEVVSLTQFKIHKGGTTIEFNTGDKNAIINGNVVEMPTAPVITRDRLFVPLRFAAETFGKNVFWDDRGLIIISDGEVIKKGQEDLIKPLLSQIRNYTTIFGNKKYSDVNISSRQYRAGVEGSWSTLDATKRFMATVDRWCYMVSGTTSEAMLDQGVLMQGALNANARDDATLMKKVTTYFIDGTPWTRGDGANGTTWGCVNNPEYKKNVYDRAKAGIDMGVFLWQFDDWRINNGYGAACFCDYCMKGFTEYLLAGNVSREELDAGGFPEITADFNYKTWLKEAKGISTINDYNGIADGPIDRVWDKYNRMIVRKFHDEMLQYMEEYAGEKIYYQINLDNSFSKVFRPDSNWLLDLSDGTQGETDGGQTGPATVFGTMLMMRALGMDNIISPLPKSQADKDLMYSAIPMCYATGQFMLVPWDVWLYGSTRYYSTVEALEGMFELPREYPWLFDNYEIPEKLGYIFDFDTEQNITPYSTKLLENGIPGKALIRMNGEVPLTFNSDNFKNIQALIATSSLDHLTDAERKMIEESYLPLIPVTDTAKIEELESTLWTARVSDDTEKVYTVLRQNQLYANAPTVVHAVNYNTVKQTDVEIEINNMYLPEGDTITVNVYRPWQNNYSIKAQKGQWTTKINIDEIDRWTILEICGPSTIRREADFYIGEGYNGIGLGTRISNDKAIGTPKNFNIITYSEGLNSTTAYDKTGTQDEAAFVYKYIGKSNLRESAVSAGFGEAPGAHGVMVREGIYSNARFVALVYDSENGLRLAERKVTDSNVEYTKISDEKPEYMKLVRKNGTFVAYTSNDNKSFTEAGSFKVTYDNPVAGVFATSPDGSRSVTNVKDMIISHGNFAAGNEFSKFDISYKNGTIENIGSDNLTIKLDTELYKDIKLTDVDVTFVSSDDKILSVTNEGVLIPKKAGNVTITATATMGMRKISDTLNLTVVNPNPEMYVNNFDNKQLPANSTKSGAATSSVTAEDGTIKITSSESGVEGNVNWTFEQKNMPAVIEFDFKAHFGTDSPTTGARLIYAHGGSGICLTADPGKLRWFYGNAQTTVADLAPDVWHHIKIEANYDEQWCNVYLDGEKVVDKGQPRGAISPNGAIQVGAWRIGKDSVYEWDNFNIYFVNELE